MSKRRVSAWCREHNVVVNVVMHTGGFPGCDGSFSRSDIVMFNLANP